MQKSRRDFAKKTAIVVGATAVSATALAAANNSGSSVDSGTHGVVVGNSPKKEILYKKTKAWEDFYKQAL